MSVKDLTNESIMLDYLKSFADDLEAHKDEAAFMQWVEELGKLDLSILLNLGTALVEATELISSVVKRYRMDEVNQFIEENYGGKDNLELLQAFAGNSGFTKF